MSVSLLMCERQFQDSECRLWFSKFNLVLGLAMCIQVHVHSKMQSVEIIGEISLLDIVSG